MSLGDKLYASASFTPPIASHAGATYADYLRRVLRQCYLHAQHHGRLLFCQPYPQPLADIQNVVENVRFRFFSDAFRGIARARCTIPRHTSHVVAGVLYAIHATSAVEASLRLVVDDGAVTDEAVRTITADVVSSRRSDDTPADGHNPFTATTAVFYDEIEVALSNVDPAEPGRCRIDVQGSSRLAETQVAREFRPLFVLGIAEMRY